MAPQLHDEEALPGEAKHSQLEFGKKETCEQLDALETAYFQKMRFMAGSKPDFMDYYVGIILSVLDKVEFDLSQWPKTKAWYDEMKRRTNEMIIIFQEQEYQSSKQG